MPRWSTTGAALVLRDLIVPLLRDVIIPGGGLFAILTDRPLTPLAAGAYLVMMGLPVAGVVDRLRERRSVDAAPTPPPTDLPPTLS
jgi:hypothetical protein